MISAFERRESERQAHPSLLAALVRHPYRGISKPGYFGVRRVDCKNNSWHAVAEHSRERLRHLGARGFSTNLKIDDQDVQILLQQVGLRDSVSC